MVNQLPTDEPSSACALCGQPFNMHNNHVYAWRSTSGKTLLFRVLRRR
jgi:hypothetical protein